MAKKKSTSKKKGIRYTDQEKAEIVQFVRDHDRKKGRGGQSAAVKKFGVSAMSISNWSKKAGKVAPKKKAVAKAVVKKTAAARPTTSKATAGSATATLKRMIAIQEQLEALQADYVVLKNQL
jgi:transposase-like protein